MKSCIFLMFLLTTDLACAEWTALDEDNEIIYFIDLSTKNTAQRPRISVLREFKQATASGDQSARLLYEADCEKNLLRLMSGVYLKKSMGTGEVSGMINSNGWMKPAARPILQKIYTTLCGSSGVSNE